MKTLPIYLKLQKVQKCIESCVNILQIETCINMLSLIKPANINDIIKKAEMGDYAIAKGKNIIAIDHCEQAKIFSLKINLPESFQFRTFA